VSDTGHSHYSMIHHCLSAVAAAPPAAATNALRGLTELLPSLPSPLALAEADSPPPQTGEQTLALIATSQLLLSQLEANEASSPVPWETAGHISHALEELSAQLGAAIRREKAGQVRGLYVIIDPQVTGGRDPLDIAIAAVNGGARMLQLRDKLRDKGESLPLAMALQDLCQRNGALLIINDHADVAAAVGSGGLHVGQTDLPVAQARQILAPYQVLGRSNREFEQLVESQEMGADHVAFGAIYATTSKGVARNPQGPGRVREAKALAKVPLVAIGGINLENVTPVVEAGADAICVTAAVGLADEPEAAAARMTAAIEAAGGRI
jgi:thiamine-phosphate pyrophosphorylase